ncbi:protein NATD1 isoform X1 [Lepidochelys kempii]|uniref:protein NATD1 isoform X1 n=1 Tax=Lepidochelys kempii TaxID=8472 RepID=UPI003C6F3863
MAHAAQLNILEQNCPIQVEHDRKRRQFTVRLNGCHDRAVLLYEYVGKRIVDLQHTEVPDAYRGRGIAKHLAKRWVCLPLQHLLQEQLRCYPWRGLQCRGALPTSSASCVGKGEKAGAARHTGQLHTGTQQAQ